MSHKPKVSVCIPSYNHARFLPLMLDSVLAQTYRDFEVILVDDGSTDDSLRIAESYAARHPSVIKVFTHPGHVNRGISETGNLAFSKSSGQYWSGLCSDDLWYPDKLELEVAYLDEHPEIGLVYGYAHVIDAEGEKLPGLIGRDITGDAITALLYGNPVPAPTLMVRRECFERLGLHDENLIYQDWELWIRFLAHWKIGFIEKPLMMYRVHGRNTSVGVDPKVNLERMLEVLLAVQAKMLSVGGALAADRTRALVSLQISYLFYCSGDTAKAAEWFSGAFETDPSLRADAGYVDEWLARRGECEILLPEGSDAEYDFGLWSLERAEPLMGKAVVERIRRRVKARHCAKGALACRQSDLRKARRLLLDCLKHDPRRLGDRALFSLFVETLVGSRAMSLARRVGGGLLRHRVTPAADRPANAPSEGTAGNL